MALGVPDVDSMLAEMTYESFVEWQQYASVEPFGEWRADLRIGQLCAIVANLFLDTKKHKPRGPADFMLFTDSAPEEKGTARGAVVAPETLAWLDMMAAKTEAENGK